MENEIKIIFTILVVLLGTVIFFIDPKANNAGSILFWKGASQDLIRKTICRSDGTLRKYTKLAVFIWFAIFLTIIWLIPSNQ